MDVSTYVAQLRNDLLAAAAAGDETTRNTAGLLAAAVEPAARLAVMNALSDLAAEVTAALDDRVVELRLDGREVRVVVSPDAHASDDEPAPDTDAGPTGNGGGWSPFGAGGPFGPGGPFGHSGSGSGGDSPFKGFAESGGMNGGDISRITLRLVEQIKGQAEQAAASQGMSLNSWVAQAVQGALGAQGRHGRPGGDERRREKTRRADDGKRLRGWVQG